MKAPALGRPAQQDDRNAEDGVMPAARQGLADFITGCATFDWSAEPISHRVLKLIGPTGSVLLASADPTTYFDTLRRISDANAFAQRHRRP
jgi:hypothetical protein